MAGAKRPRVLSDIDVHTLNLFDMLCGARLLNGPSLGVHYKVIEATTGLFENDDDSIMNIGMVRPSLHPSTPLEAAKIVHLYLERQSSGKNVNPPSTFVALDTADEAETQTFFARPKYSLHEVLPAKTLVHAFAFLDANSNTILSIFDCSVLKGKCLRDLSPTERFWLMHSELRPRTLIGHHWVGQMSVAREQFYTKKTPFLVHSLLRVPYVLRHE